MFVASRSILCCTRTRTSGTSGTQYNNVRRPYGFTSKRESDARVCRPVSPVVPSHSESTECIPYFVFYLCKRSASVCVCDWHLIGAITVRCVCALARARTNTFRTHLERIECEYFWFSEARLCFSLWEAHVWFLIVNVMCASRHGHALPVQL